MYYVGSIPVYPSDELAHFGIKGMKWGQRRWQNEDGTFNEAGKRRYFEGVSAKLAVAGAAGSALLGRASRIAGKIGRTAQNQQWHHNALSNQAHETAKGALNIALGRSKDLETAERWTRQFESSKQESRRLAAEAMEYGKKATAALRTQKAMQIAAIGLAGTAAVGVGIYAANKIMKKRAEKREAKSASK